jgi:hypothetical protein
MSTLCVISCGARKVWDDNPSAGPTKTRHVYTGPLSRKLRQYAEMFFPNCWCILSAKYGFLFPDDMVPGPYNVKMGDPEATTQDQLWAQVASKRLDRYGTIVVLGGKRYAQAVHQAFPGKDIRTPLSGSKGIGDMMRRLKQAIESGTPL